MYLSRFCTDSFRAPSCCHKLTAIDELRFECTKCGRVGSYEDGFIIWEGGRFPDEPISMAGLPPAIDFAIAASAKQKTLDVYRRVQKREGWRAALRMMLRDIEDKPVAPPENEDVAAAVVALAELLDQQADGGHGKDDNDDNGRSLL